MTFKFTNNPSSKLLSAITNTATGLVALSGEGSKFPPITNPDEFRITIFDQLNVREICKVTAITGDTFTVIRSQEGTIAPIVGWPANTAFRLQLTKETLEAFLQLDDEHKYTKQQGFPETTLTYGANISWALQANQVSTVLLTGTTAQLDNPTQLINGFTYILIVLNDATGGRGMTYDTDYDFGADGAPDHSLRAANKFDVVTFVAHNNKMRGAYQLDFAL